MLLAAAGTYILLLRCTATCAITVGRIGRPQLRPGYYLYVGSAFGPGGLRARIGHHLRRAVRPRWHIDYLRRYTRLEGVWYCCGSRCEHEWAAAISAIPGVEVEMLGFGSSDCRCRSHLYWVSEQPGTAFFVAALGPNSRYARLLEFLKSRPGD